MKGNKAAQAAVENEFTLIRRLAGLFKSHPPQGWVGIGDDCALIPCADKDSGDLLISCDSLVEDRDFRRSYCPPFLLGRKLLSVNLSDIAAMGGRPECFLINLQLPPSLESSFAEEIYSGLNQVAEEYGIFCIGGDTSEASEISLGLTIIGRTTGRPLLRSRAEKDDRIWVSGELGASRYALELFESASAEQLEALYDRAEAKRFLDPAPRLELGKFLAKNNLAHAAIDLSDGLVQDLSHILVSSSRSAEINLDSIPSGCPGDMNKLAALRGGEDFELLFTAPDSSTPAIEGFSQESGLRLTCIGRILEGTGAIKLVDFAGNLLTPEQYAQSLGLDDLRGYEHFAKKL